LKQEFRDGIAKAIKRNGHDTTVDAVVAAIEAGKLVLYSSANSCLVAAYEDGPDGLEGYGIYVAGTLRELVAEVIPQAELDARKRGAVRIYQNGFKGYQRVLNKAGFRLKTVLMQKELVDV
jgi:phytoene/squalene synthetase